MGKVRINDLSRELAVKSIQVVRYLEATGYRRVKHCSSIDDSDVARIREHFGPAEPRLQQRRSVTRMPSELGNGKKVMNVRQDLGGRAPAEETHSTAKKLVLPVPAESRPRYKSTLTVASSPDTPRSNRAGAPRIRGRSESPALKKQAAAPTGYLGACRA